MKRFYETDHEQDLTGREHDGIDNFENDGCESCTGGDYGPSDPWNAPGMRVSDFI